jgi:phospholipase/carboxylesterase
MNLIQSTLEHLVLPPNDSPSAKHPTIIMLHGRGADEHDLVGLADYLDPSLFVVSVRAPFPFQWGGGYTWYDILEVGSPEPRMFAESYRKLTQFMSDALSQYPIDGNRVFLLGFSMGTMMSYSLLLTRPELFAGVVANSGYVPEDVDLRFQWETLAGKQIFVSHGANDPIIPIGLGRRARELLESAQAEVTYREYDMAHQMSDESVKDIAAWLGERLKSKCQMPNDKSP